MSENNYGISTSGGNVTATNLAVGEGATITVSGDMLIETKRELDTIRTLLDSSKIPAEQKSELSAAVETIATEVSSKNADKSKVTKALNILEKVTKIGSDMTDLGIKLAPHLVVLVGLLF